MDLIQDNAAPQSPFLEAVSGILGGSWTAAEVGLLDQLDFAENQAVDAVVSTVLKKTYLSRFVETRYQIAVENPQAVKAVPTLTLVCQNCQTIVNLPPPDTRWYCVTRGIRIGFVRGWDNVKRLVLHVPDNKYASYANKEMARKAFIMAVASKEAHVIATVDEAVAYDPVPSADGFLYP